MFRPKVFRCKPVFLIYAFKKTNKESFSASKYIVLLNGIIVFICISNIVFAYLHIVGDHLSQTKLIIFGIKIVAL